MSDLERRNLEAFSRLPVNVQRAASRLVEDMSAFTGEDESSSVLEALAADGRPAFFLPSASPR